MEQPRISAISLYCNSWISFITITARCSGESFLMADSIRCRTSARSIVRSGNGTADNPSRSRTGPDLFLCDTHPPNGKTGGRRIHSNPHYNFLIMQCPVPQVTWVSFGRCRIRRLVFKARETPRALPPIDFDRNESHGIWDRTLGSSGLTYRNAAAIPPSAHPSRQ